MPEILETLITCLPNILQAGNFEDWPLKRALAKIKKGAYKDLTLKARGILQDKGEDAYRNFKATLPSFAFNGLFKDKVTNANFQQSSGLVILDVDKLSPKRMQEVKDRKSVV